MVSTAVAYDIVARDKASKAFRDVANSASASHKRISKVSQAIKGAGLAIGGAAVAGAAVFVKQSVSLEAQFSKTMNMFQATTGASGKQMKQMSDLAIKMGQDTVFSAKDAADAMLELGKGGLKPATIQAGALRATMNLAAAGGMEMGVAANTAVKAMGAFNLTGKQANQVANALAGAANASAADVSDLSYALAQAGQSAHGVGFNIQETTGILAAFSNAGINGSDAGTSLKTMLSRLQPVTKSATLAMESVGLWTKKSGSAFVKANGQYKSAAQIAGILHDKLGKLAPAQRQAALQTIFGSDAMRAASILTNEGAKGLQRYIKATSNQKAAQKMAQAGMKGTAGAIEQLKGSLETVQLQFGMLIAPVVQAGLKAATGLINKLGQGVGSLSKAFHGGGGGGMGAALAKVGQSLATFGKALLPTLEAIGRQIIGVVGPGFKQIAGLIQTQLLPAFSKILPIITPVVKFILQMIGGAIVGAIKGAIQVIKGVINVVAGVFSLISDLIHGRWSKAWHDLVQILKGVLDIVIGAIKVWLNVGILGIFRKGVVKLLFSWRGLWDGVKKVGTKALEAVKKFIGSGLKFVGGLFVKGVKLYLGIWKRLFTVLWDIAKNGWKVLRSAFGGAWAAIKTMFSQAVERLIGLFKSLWGWVKSTFTRQWNTLKTIVTNPIQSAKTVLGKVLDGIQTAFSKAVDAIGKIWGKLKDAAAAPVRFVVNTVYTDGIRRVVNLLPGVPDLPSLHMARGGVLPGYTPGRDVHDFYSTTGGKLSLSGGEGIMVPEWVRAMGGPAAVARMNKAARSGRLRRAGDVGAFAGGGTLSPEAIARAQKFAKAQVGKPYVWGGVGPGGYDCSGFMSAITNVLRGAYPYSRIGSTANFPWPGFRRGVGEFTIGSTNNYGGSGVGHMAGTLAGLRVESYGGHGPSTSNRGYDDPGFSTVAHLGAGGKAAAKSGGFFHIIGQIKGFVSKIGGWISDLVHMGGWGGMIRKVVSGVLSGLRNFVNDKIPGPGPIPGGVFDRGGLARGPGVMRKGPRPERVLSARQTEAFEQLVSLLDGGAIGRGMTVHEGAVQVNMPATATPEAAAEAAGQRLVAALSAVGI